MTDTAKAPKNISAAAKAALNLAKTFKNVVEVGEYLQSVDNLENMAKEAQRAADTARQEAHEAQADEEAAKARLDEANKAVDTARIQAKAIVEKAQMEAAEIIRTTQAGQTQQVQAFKDKYEAVVEEWRNRAADAEVQYNALLAKKDSVQDKVDELEAYLMDLRKKLG